MDDVGSMVVVPAHEIGSWRGPAQSPWVRRIAHGAGFSNQWDLNREADAAPVLTAVVRPPAAPPQALLAPAEPLAAAAPDPSEATVEPSATAADPPAAPSLRLWWLPSAHEG